MRSWIVVALVVLGSLSRAGWAQEAEKPGSAEKKGAEKPGAANQGAEKQSDDAAGPAAREAALAQRLERLDRRLEELKARRREEKALRRWERSIPWHWYPWSPLPQSSSPEPEYGPSIEHTPRIGLGLIYRNADHFGIRPPVDSDPLVHEPNLGPFVGVVAAAKAEAALEAEKEAADAAARAPADDHPAVVLLRAGKAREAGKLAAAEYQETQSAASQLLLVEAFVSLGKYSTAGTLLESALAEPDATKALPESLATHFPSAEEFEKRVQEIDSLGGQPLLLAYLRLHTAQSAAAL